MKYKIDEYRNKLWYNENHQLHREDGPAIERKNGYKEWWINGKYHKEHLYNIIIYLKRTFI